MLKANKVITSVKASAFAVELTNFSDMENCFGEMMMVVCLYVDDNDGCLFKCGTETSQPRVVKLSARNLMVIILMMMMVTATMMMTMIYI